MKEEIKEKNRFIKIARDKGYWCEGVETNRPGFPDVVFRNKSGLILIEFKYFEEKDRKKTPFQLFTKGQFPWMMNYIQFGGGMVSDLEVVFCDGVHFYGFAVTEPMDLVFLKEKSLDEVLKLCEGWF